MPGELSNLICIDESIVDREEHIIATYEIETSPDTTLGEIGETIAYDPTIGTWERTAGESDDLIQQYSGKFLLPLPDQAQQSGQIRIAIPIRNIDPIAGGLPQLLAILGAPYTLKSIEHIRLTNLDLPRRFTEHWPGPRLGQEGVFAQFGSQFNRPLIAMMLKPRTGLSTDEYAQLALEAYRGGVDIVFDDELMVSPDSSPLLERMARLVEVASQAERETGEPKRYAANITSSIRYTVSLALKAQDLGVQFLYLNPITMGLPTLEMLATTEEIKVPLLCCRSGYGMWTRGRDGLSYFVLLKLARWVGADGIHIGSIGGSLPHAIIGDDGELLSRVNWLRAGTKTLRRACPIVSGGIHPGNVEWNIKRLGREIILQSGSGVLAHPDGPRAGAAAMRAAVVSTTMNMPTFECAANDPALRTALEKWGYLNGKGIHTYQEMIKNSSVEGHTVINTAGGMVVMGDVTVQGGQLIGRDSQASDQKKDK
jgi:ribulose-bisphosphate carboxylase large chain